VIAAIRSSLAYIWSGVNFDVVYKTGHFTVNVGPFSISSSGATFTVTNNQFGETRTIDAVAKVPNLGDDYDQWSGDDSHASQCAVTVLGDDGRRRAKRTVHPERVHYQDSDVPMAQ